MEIDIILNEFASPQAALELGLMAERYGIRGVWASNYGWSRDPFFTLSLLAHQSSRIRLGPMAISPAELHPLKMANLLFSLNELSQGRAMIMVGGGGAVAQSMGRKRERMIRGARECLEILKGASPDRMLNYGGQIHQVWGYQPKWYTDTPPLIYFGSNHPQTRRLSAQLADGLITSDFVVPLAREFIAAARDDLRAAGRDPARFRFSNFWAWHIKADPAASMAEARRELMLRGWLGEQYFAPFLDPDEVRLMRAHERDFLNAFLRGSSVIENVPDTLVDKMIRNISFAGGLDQIEPAIETLKGFAEAGLTEIALRVHDDPADAIRLIGERVLPALRQAGVAAV
ncbi:MAG: LLM class flavin-dependent oxidoreductase [Chromatiales bacterium]|jgi:5,10-methylenetetrahydromethanopterin reductase|nr:LLM class flavin-dependent oxidoreductase [Chromatiales bacterium]